MASQTQWKLTLKEGSKPSFTVMLSCGEKVLVGRSRSCDIILSDPSVSRKHCFFSVSADGAIKLVDLGALHRTMLNGVALEEGCAVQVQDGSKVRLGRASFITVEYLIDKDSGKTDQEDSLVDEDVEDTRTEVLEKAVQKPFADEDEGDDAIVDQQTSTSAKEKAKGIPGEAEQRERPSPELPKELNNSSSDNDRDIASRQSNVPQLSGPSSDCEAEQQDETSIVYHQEPQRGSVPENVISQNTHVESPGCKEEPDDDHEDKSVDDATKLSQSDLLKQSCKKENNSSDAQGDVNDSHTRVLGKTLQGKLILPKKSQSEPQVNNEDQSGVDAGDLCADESRMTSQPCIADPDETNFIDPAELKKLVKGKGGPAGGRGGRKGSPPARSSGPADDAENTGLSGGDDPDETNFIDPAELRKLVKGKGGPAGGRGGRKGSPPARSSGPADDAENTGLSGGDDPDETNYIDPAELRKLVKGKGGPAGGRGGRKGSPPARSSGPADDAENTALSGGDDPDETNYIDPAELKKLVKGKGAFAGGRGGRKSAPPARSSGPVNDAENTGLSGGDDPDETNYIDPAELKKLMKGKAGSPGGRGGRKSAPPVRPSGPVNDAENTGMSGGDDPDETNYIDPAELKKLMKDKERSRAKKRGKRR